jgi:hypothetical protein
MMDRSNDPQCDPTSACPEPESEPATPPRHHPHVHRAVWRHILSIYLLSGLLLCSLVVGAAIADDLRLPRAVTRRSLVWLWWAVRYVTTAHICLALLHPIAALILTNLVLVGEYWDYSAKVEKQVRWKRFQVSNQISKLIFLAGSCQAQEVLARALFLIYASTSCQSPMIVFLM